MIKVAIAGATGYTGSELIRILMHHPEAQIIRVTSEQHAGEPVSSVFPQFRNMSGLKYESLGPAAIAKNADVVFLALPHTLSMKFLSTVLKTGVPCIDLSADFRLKDKQLYSTWYHVEHATPELLATSVYGLTELNREAVRTARLLANPGCYPTCALLGLAPLVREELIRLEEIIIDAKSGTSGAGKTPRPQLHFPEVHEALMAYRVGDHQHTPEIEQELSRLAAQNMVVNFTPHLIPMNRGILCTAYASLKKEVSDQELHEKVKAFYKNEPFVSVLEPGSFPNTRDVRGTNRCDIGVKADKRTGRVIVVSVIDNLVKGASGQAVQNMNLMMGIEESTGLDLAPLAP